VGKTTIELNGKQYDAATGAFLGDVKPVSNAQGRAVLAPKKSITVAPSATEPKSAPAPIQPRHQGRAIDGFIKAPKPGTHAAQHQTASKPAAPIAAKVQPKTHAPLATKKLLTAHKPEHSKTLMRNAVHKPDVKIKPAIKVQKPAEVAARPVQALVPKLSATHIDPRREQHASEVPRSELVRKFNRNNQASREQLHKQATGRVTVHQAHQAAAAAHNNSVRPMAQQRPHSAVASTGPARTHASQPLTREEQTTRMFEQALANATSHEQPAPKIARKRKATRKHRGLINALAGVAAVLVIAAFVAYLNAPKIELHVASVQAGFSASMPAYKPSGFALNGGIKSQNGVVSINFSSKSSGDNYKVTQEASTWDSSTLYDNLVAVRGGAKQTLQNGGRTIYVYGNNQAAWVNGGVLYQVSGSAGLSSDQIGNIATSM
jgi:hypothetical protein